MSIIKDEQAKFAAFMKVRDQAVPNNSGQGDQSILPDELRGMNWGGLLMNIVWGIGMKVPAVYTLLYLVPIVGMFMPFVMLYRGNEWAWKYRKWDSIAHFRKVQERWVWWGVALLVASMLLSMLMMNWINRQFSGILAGSGLAI